MHVAQNPRLEVVKTFHVQRAKHFDRAHRSPFLGLGFRVEGLGFRV